MWKLLVDKALGATRFLRMCQHPLDGGRRHHSKGGRALDDRAPGAECGDERARGRALGDRAPGAECSNERARGRALDDRAPGAECGDERARVRR